MVERLVRTGHDVRAMARSDGSAEVVRRYGATPVRCELDAVRAEHLAGCEAVIHAAARAEEWGTREQFWRANVEGTEAMLDAARAAQVRRFVHVGTEAAIFDGHDLVGVDESAPFPRRQRYLYSETKAEAERRVLAARSEALETIVIRPRLVWGPRDQSVLPAISARAREGKFAWLDQGRARTSTTHVTNVAHALELALTHGTGGRAYFVADDGTRTVREFLAEYARRGAGVELGERSVPSWLARPLARVIEGTWQLLRLRSTPPMTRFAVDMLSSTVTVDDRAARRDLGYAPIVSVEEGLRALGEVSPRPGGA